MPRSDLGEFEKVVLLTVDVLSPKAYSVVIAQELEEATATTISTGAVHAALQRLENKGLVNSHMGEATQERGGRRKRLFTLTPAGSRILHELCAVRESLWHRIQPHALPKVKLT